MGPKDARLEELQFLAKVERDQPVPHQGYIGKPTLEDQMIASFLLDGYLNDNFERLRSLAPGETHRAVEMLRVMRSQLVGDFVQGAATLLWMTHKGRVRLSELRQQLQTGRDRDETGMLWAKRHLVTDLSIATLSASNESPLSIVFLDMNGLGVINNTYGHQAGDQTIRAFFDAVLTTLGEFGDAYRNGGDEVVVILPGVPDERARELLHLFVRQLGKDPLSLGEANAQTFLSASCGSASTARPDERAAELLDRVDKIQYRAKAVSKEHTPRVSAIAVAESPVATYSPIKN